MAKKDDYKERLQKMVEYIEQDGHEKAEEVDVLAEEEYFIEKKNYLDQRVGAVKNYYDNLEKKYQQQIVLDISKIKNQAYRDILSARNSVVEEVFESVRTRLTQITHENNVCFYKKILYLLTIQGLMKIMEPVIAIEVRKKDVFLAHKVMKQATEFFHSKTGMTVKLEVSESNFLPDKTNGGILMHTGTKSRSISLNNTLDSKLELVRANLMPFVRKALFGANPNRRHSD